MRVNKDGLREVDIKDLSSAQLQYFIGKDVTILLG